MGSTHEQVVRYAVCEDEGCQYCHNRTLDTVLEDGPFCFWCIARKGCKAQAMLDDIVDALKEIIMAHEAENKDDDRC